MTEKKFPILMYHRVEDSAYMHRVGLKLSGEHCTLERFRSQMKQLTKDYLVLPLNEIVNKLRQKDELPDKIAAITFDDGTRDHVEIVLPILKEFGLSATFSVMSAPLNDKIPPTFKMQLITGGGIDLNLVANDYFPATLEKLAPEFAEKYKAGIQVPKERYIGEQFEIVRQMKYLFNYMLPAATKDLVADGLFIASFGNHESEIASKMFMGSTDLKLLAKSGMEIACHSKNHYNLSTIENWPDVMVEVVVSRVEISRASDALINLFFYPAGGRQGYTPKIVELVRQHYTGAFITGTQQELCGTTESIYELSRLHEKFF